MLRRSPGFSILAILCLTLGIGANAAVFQLGRRGFLFRPYPAVTHQEQLLAPYRNGARRVWPPLVLPGRISSICREVCRLIDSFIVTKIMGTTLSVGDGRSHDRQHRIRELF